MLFLARKIITAVTNKNSIGFIDDLAMGERSGGESSLLHIN